MTASGQTEKSNQFNWMSGLGTTSEINRVNADGSALGIDNGPMQVRRIVSDLLQSEQNA